MSALAIPEEILAAGRRRLKRKAASMLAMALAESGHDTSIIDTRLGQKPGWAISYFVALIEGKTTDLDILSDLCCALGVEVHIAFTWPRAAQPSAEDEQ